MTTTCFHGANERFHDKIDLSVQQVERIIQRIDFICGSNIVFRCSSRFAAALSSARVAKSRIEDVLLSMTSCIRSFVSAFFTCVHLIEPGREMKILAVIWREDLQQLDVTSVFDSQTFGVPFVISRLHFLHNCKSLHFQIPKPIPQS